MTSYYLRRLYLKTTCSQCKKYTINVQLDSSQLVDILVFNILSV